MNSRSLTTTRLAAAALVLLLAVLACNLPIQTPNSAPVEIDVPPAEEMDPPSEVLVSPEDVPSPEVVPPWRLSLSPQLEFPACSRARHWYGGCRPTTW